MVKDSLTVPKPNAWPEYFRKQADLARDSRLKRYFEAGVIDPQTPMRNVPMVALDFETTGLDPEAHGIVSIGMVPFSLDRIRCRNASHFIVKPRQDLSSESIVIHGITHAAVEEAPDLDEILDVVLPALAHQLVVVHYRQIERFFLDKALLKRLNEHIVFPVIDTMALEERILKMQQPRLSRWLSRPLPSLRLPDARERYGLPRYHLHHAMTDALATAELLQAQMAHHFDPEMPVQSLWC